MILKVMRKAGKQTRKILKTVPLKFKRKQVKKVKSNFVNCVKAGVKAIFCEMKKGNCNKYLKFLS